MKSLLEVFRKLEREVRAAKERLPIDAFLPSPDTLATEFPEPPPTPLTAHVRELGATADEGRDRRKVRRARKPSPQAAPKNLEEEINQFINRDKAEGVQEEDLSEFLGGFDPSEIPEK